MLKRIHVIGIGMGNPDHVTREAIRALNEVDVFIVADKGEAKSDLVAARQAICDEFITPDRSYRVVEVTDPQRGSDRERDGAAYDQGVRDWHAARVDAYAAVIDGLADGEESVGFLVWGDPAFYDSTLRIVDALRERREVEVHVVAGISAPQLLAARHGIALNRIGAPIHITTGRRLVDEYDPTLGDVVVMLDGHLRCAELVDRFPELEIWWGAQLGGPGEALVSGRLTDVLERIRQERKAIRDRDGWVMDTYLLRSPLPEPVAPTERIWPDVDELTDGVITLRPLAPDDWPVLLAEANNAESLGWGFAGKELTEAEARTKAAGAREEWVSGRGARFVIVDAVSGEGAGVLGVMRMGPPGVGLIGYGVIPQFRGRGFTTRALELVAQWVFAETQIGRLELGHKIDNVASGRVATRAGWVAEGHLRGRLINPDGTFSDEIYYGRTRPV